MSRVRAHMSTCRPWREVFDLHGFSLPGGLADGCARIRRNSNYFRANYTLFMVSILFLSLVFHPISMIVFLVLFVAWLYFYLFWEEPIVVLNNPVDDRVVFAGLVLVSALGLVLTNVGLNVLVSSVIGLVVVRLHAGCRSGHDLFLDEHEAAEGGSLMSVGGG